MNPIQNNIKIFLESNKISTVCFVDGEGKPYCINCFYVFDEINTILIFKSTAGTKHQEFTKPAANISGTILPDTIDILNIKGVQFFGKLIDKKEIETLKLNSKYLKKYPMSLAILGYVWAVKLEFIKFTDNTLGFGNKTVWELK